MRTVFKLFAVFAMFAALSASASAQDRVKVGVLFQNLNVANQNLPGIDATIAVKAVEFGKWKFDVVADGAFHYDTNQALNRYQLLGGGQLSYSPGEGQVSFFGRAMSGVTRFDQRNNLKDFARVTTSLGGGVDVRLNKRLSVRPVQFDLQYIDERPVRYTRLGSGLVFDLF